MINLLPPDGKKNVVVEYWLRVASVALVMLGSGLLLVSILLLPTYFYISFQSHALGVSVEAVSEEAQSFEELEEEIDLANDISELLVETAYFIEASEVIAEIQSFSGDQLEVQDIRIDKDGRQITSVQVSGAARDRAALVAFRDSAEASRLFKEVDLPISNLAQNQNIRFTLVLEPSEVVMTAL